MRTGVLLLVAMLLLPTAAASSGTLLTEGGVDVPAGATVRFTPKLLFLDVGEAAPHLEVRAASLTVHHFRQPFREVTPPVADAPPVQWRGQVERETIALRDVLVRQGQATGDPFLGFYPDASAGATLVPSTNMTWEPRDGTAADTSVVSLTTLGRDERHEPDFHARVEEPHLAAEAPGLLRYEGKGVLKVRGVDLVVSSAEFAGTLPTGMERSSDGPLREGTLHWAVLEFEDAVLEVRSAVPWLLAAPEAEARWEGEAVLRGARGEIRADGTRYVAAGGTARIEGAFEALLSPQRDGSGRVVARVDLRGDLASTSLRPEPVAVAGTAVAPRPALEGWLALALGAVALAGAGGVALGHRLPRRDPAPRPEPSLPWTAEDCREAGAAAASEEDWARAAEWFERGQRLAPTSARMNADLAFALSQIGDHERALHHFAQASRLSTDGEADVNGALAAMAAGRPDAEVEAWLVRALARSPEFVVQVDEDQEFQHLQDRPAFRRAVSAAWREVARREAGGEG